MINRTLSSQINNAFNSFPIVGLLGPRQVGKTTLAKQICADHNHASVYLDLELPSDVFKLADPESYLRQHEDKLVILDEIQRMPSLFPVLRALVDAHRRPGRFLLLGSASLDLIKHASESLAGRIHYFELAPFSLQEVGNEALQTLWLRGGYPESFLATADDKSFVWRESFIRTYLEQDVPQLGIRIPSMQLRRFWIMIAHCHGQLWNASQIATSLGISAPTVRHYLDILEQTYLIRRLQPYYTNIKKRLIKSPKIYVRDTGLLHTLLGEKTYETLHAHPQVGHSWEGFVLEQIITMLPPMWTYYFYRTVAGAEIDLLLFNERNEPIAIEIKHATTPHLSKGSWNAFNDIPLTKAFVVYRGNEYYAVKENVYLLPVTMLNKIVEGALTIKEKIAQ